MCLSLTSRALLYCNNGYAHFVFRDFNQEKLSLSAKLSPYRNSLPKPSRLRSALFFLNH